jgi:hypothetical protein
MTLEGIEAPPWWRTSRPSSASAFRSTRMVWGDLEAGDQGLDRHVAGLLDQGQDLLAAVAGGKRFSHCGASPA